MSSRTTNMTLSNPTALILRSSCALVLPLFIGE